MNPCFVRRRFYVSTIKHTGCTDCLYGEMDKKSPVFLSK